MSDVSKDGCTVDCTVTDALDILRVQFPTWSLANGQDDLVPNWETSAAVSGTASGSTYTFRVKASDHNGEGGAYLTHIYAWDKLGNVTSVSTGTVQIEDETEPPSSPA